MHTDTLLRHTDRYAMLIKKFKIAILANENEKILRGCIAEYLIYSSLAH